MRWIAHGARMPPNGVQTQLNTTFVEGRMKGLPIFAGIVLILIGAAGFVPALSPDGVLFGVVALQDIHKYIMIGVGVVLAAFGFMRRRDVPPPRGPDLRDLRSDY
jgi:hypothetical protein